jgi:RNA polymerase sigma-70 factor (ECF subfamily)
MAQRSMTLSHKPQTADRPPDAFTPGDLPAFEAFFNLQWTRLCAALVSFTGDGAEAEDLALEAFIQLWRRPPPRADNLAGWLYRVATRLGLNRLRAAARRDRYELDAARQGSLPADPEAEAGRRLERARVRAVLARMDERQARLLLLRHAGFSYQEIAAALDLNPASVGALLHRAEEEFERQFSPAPEGP